MTESKAPSDSFGLSEKDRNIILYILKKFTEIRTVRIFGSRAKGNYKKGSDIDLAVMDIIDDRILGKIQSEFEYSNLPYRVDIIFYPSLTHLELKEHIDRVGIVFYEKNAPPK